MAFKKEILDCLSPVRAAFGFRYTVVFGTGGYFENVLKIGEISTYSVTLLAKSGVYRVCGQELKLLKYCDGDLAIGGCIDKVEKCQ